MAPRAWLLAGLFLLFYGVFVVRLFQLQVVEGEAYVAAVDSARTVEELLPPRRGRLLDRHGTALVDNRAVYDVAITFSEIDLSRWQQLRTRFRSFDQAAIDRLVTDCSLRLGRSDAAVREPLLEVLEGEPTVAIRRRQSEGQSRSNDAALLSVQLSGTPAEAEALRALVETRRVHVDPRDALELVLAESWDEDVHLLEPDTFQEVCAEMDRQFAIQLGTSQAILSPFAPVISIGPSESDPLWHWRLLASGRWRQGQQALARFLGEHPDLIDSRFRRIRNRMSDRAPGLPSTFYASPSEADAIAGLLPDASTMQTLQVSGLPPERERIYVLQEDRGDNRPFTALAHKIAASIGADADWIAAMLRDHAPDEHAITLERRYRVHQLALRHDLLTQLLGELTETLRRSGIETDVLELEAAITSARRLADRDWAGSRRFDPIPIVRDVDRAVAITLDSMSQDLPGDLAEDYYATEDRLPGISIITDIGRQYPFAGHASHLIGYLGRLSAFISRREAAMRALDPQGWKGVAGLERVYDTQLQGVAGKRVKRRIPGGYEVLRLDPPIPGSDVQLELDMELQIAAEAALADWRGWAERIGTPQLYLDRFEKAAPAGKGRAAMVLMDCETGGVLVQASTPGYDIREIREKYSELLAAPGQPLIDQTVTASHLPGSVMKLAVGIGALVDGVYAPGEIIHSKGYMAIYQGQRILREHDNRADDYDMIKAIYRSSNVFFATMAERLGGDRLAWWYRQIGIGRDNAFDIDWQRTPPLPTPSTIRERRPDDPTWYPSDTWRLGIGQFWPAAPIQVVAIPAAIANGGYAVSPHLAQPPEGPPPRQDLGMDQTALRMLQKGMIDTTQHHRGTARRLQLELPFDQQVVVAAKTGTSQRGTPQERASWEKPNHAWLMGYAPADNPRVAFCIFIHSGVSGGAACSGVAKHILERYFERYGPSGHPRYER